MSADDKFTNHILTVLAAACGTVGAAVAGSFLGTGGTLGGMFIGSALSGTAAYWVERTMRRAKAITAAKARAVRERGGRPLTVHETQIVSAEAIARYERAHTSRIYRRRWYRRPVVTMSALGLALGLVAVGTWELAAARSISDITNPAPSSSAPAPKVTPTVTITRHTVITRPRRHSTAPVTPSPVITTPTPSAEPSTSPPPTGSPSASPSASPTHTHQVTSNSSAGSAGMPG